jgi:muramoyltetrapeptide carboxypeptidase
MRLVKPKKIKKKAVIGLISPASSPDNHSSIGKGVKYLESLGYRVKVGKNVGKSDGYLAGSDKERINDLHDMFRDKDVSAIICIRGGYGASRLLDSIDYKLIRNNPKIFVGYSEITTLQMAFLQKAGLITFAGPMLAPNLSNKISSFTEEIFWRSLTSNKKLGRIKLPADGKLPGINRGSISGRIVGGNLAVFAALFGTDYFPDIKNKILLLEDIGEVPYKVDRLMNQIRLAKVFKRINGLILGRFVDCFEHDPSKQTLTLGEVMDSYLHNLTIPIIYTFPHGHIDDTVTIPLGINVKIDATKGFVELLESGVK